MSKPPRFLNPSLIASVAAAGCIMAVLASGGQAKADLTTTPSTPEARAIKKARCVNTRIDRVAVVNDRTIMVTDDYGRQAVMSLSGPCLKDASAQIVIQTSGTSDSICDPQDADLQVSLNGTIQLTCRITSIRQINS